MRKAATIFAAASLAVAGMGIAGCQNPDRDETDMTGSTHGGVRTGTAGMAGRNPSRSPSMGGSGTIGGAGTTGYGTMDGRTAGVRGTAGAGTGGVGAGTGTGDQYGNQGTAGGNVGNGGISGAGTGNYRTNADGT